MYNQAYTPKALERIEQLREYLEYLKALPQTNLILHLMNDINEDLAWIHETGYASEEEALCCQQ